MIEGLGFVRLEVRDLERSLAFYRRGLRFSVAEAPGTSPNGLVRLVAGSFCLEICEASGHSDTPPPSGTAPSEHGGNGDATSGIAPCGIDLSIRVRGLDAYHDALVARGLEPSAPRDSAQGRAFMLRDPDGYRWRFEQSLA